MGDKADKMGGLCTRNAFLRRVRGALLQGVVSMRMGTRIAVGGLSLTAAGLLAIADFEGFRSEAYIPVEGDVPTIGFGSTEGVKLGDTISVPDALNRLEKDVRVAEDAVRSCVTVPLTQGEMDAYTSLAYNIGRANFCGSTLVKKLNAGDYRGACEEIKRWHFAGGKSLKGLVDRREDEYRRCIGEVQ